MSSNEQPTDVVKRHGTIFVAIQGVQVLGATLVVPAITRILSPSEYGKVAAASVLAFLLGTLLALGLPTTLMRRSAQANSQRALAPDYLAAHVTFLAITGGVIAVVFLLPHEAVTDVGGSFVLTIIAVVAAATHAFFSSCLAYFRVARKVREFGYLSLGMAPGAQLVGVVVTILFRNSRHAEFYFAVTTVTGVAITALAMARVYGGVGWQAPRGVWGRSRGLVREGLPLVPSAATRYFLSAGDRLLLAAFIGSIGVARYQVAYALGALPAIVLGAYYSSWAPAVYGAASTELRTAVIGPARGAAALCAPIATCVSFGAPWLLRLAAPPSYDTPATRAVIYVICAVWPLYLLHLAWAALAVRRRQNLRLGIVTVAAALANIVANLLLVRRIGLVGAAIATTVAYALLALPAMIRVVRSDLGREGREMVLWMITVPMTGFLCPLLDAFPSSIGSGARACVAVIAGAVASRFALRSLRLSEEAHGTA